MDNRSRSIHAVATPVSFPVTVAGAAPVSHRLPSCDAGGFWALPAYRTVWVVKEPPTVGDMETSLTETAGRGSPGPAERRRTRVSRAYCGGLSVRKRPGSGSRGELPT